MYRIKPSFSLSLVTVRTRKQAFRDVPRNWTPSILHKQPNRAFQSGSQFQYQQEWTSKDVTNWGKRILRAVVVGRIVFAGIGILGMFISSDLMYAHWRKTMNEQSLLQSVEDGSCPEPEPHKDELVVRQNDIDKLESIFDLCRKRGFYHAVFGAHGTGKTTVVRQTAKKIGKGIIYVDVPNTTKKEDVEDKLGDAIAKALGWSFEEHISFTAAMLQKFLRIPLDSGKHEGSKVDRALTAFGRAAIQYKAKNGGNPPVILLDNLNRLKGAHELMDYLQDTAKDHADARDYIIVFISSEGAIPRRMMERSAWSRSLQPITVVGDITESKALEYMQKLGIKQDAENLYKLVGGRLVHLKMFGSMQANGAPFESVCEAAFSVIGNDFGQLDMLQEQLNNHVGQDIAQKLMLKKTLTLPDFFKLANNQQIANTLLQGNVFFFNPADRTVTFHSALTELYVREVFMKKQQKWFGLDL